MELMKGKYLGWLPRVNIWLRWQDMPKGSRRQWFPWKWWYSTTRWCNAEYHAWLYKNRIKCIQLDPPEHIWVSVPIYSFQSAVESLNYLQHSAGNLYMKSNDAVHINLFCHCIFIESFCIEKNRCQMNKHTQKKLVINKFQCHKAFKDDLTDTNWELVFVPANPNSPRTFSLYQIVIIIAVWYVAPSSWWNSPVKNGYTILYL